MGDGALQSEMIRSSTTRLVLPQPSKPTTSNLWFPMGKVPLAVPVANDAVMANFAPSLPPGHTYACTAKSSGVHASLTEIGITTDTSHAA